MRITNAAMVSTYLKNLNRNSNKLDQLQNQISTGRNFTRASDDPLNANKAMQFRSNLNKVKQYSTNVTEAREWMTQTESSLNEMNDIFSRAYELAVKGNTASNGPDERNAIAAEIGQLAEQLVVSGNTQFAGRYVFGGSNTLSAPFEVQNVSGAKELFYNGENVRDLALPANSTILENLSSEKLSYEIGFGANLDISYTGIDIMGTGDKNAYAVLNDLQIALKNGNMTKVSESISLVQDKRDNVVSLLGDIGGKSNRLEFFSSRLEMDEQNYKSMLSEAEDVDITQAIMDMKMQESVYEAALSAGSKIITQTLADFIK